MAFRPFGKKEDKKGILRLPVEEKTVQEGGRGIVQKTNGRA
jgi:hypothetical protein